MHVRQTVTDAFMRLPAPVRQFMQVLVSSRIIGVAAECAFWITFTLPWIALGLLASVGAIATRFDPSTVAKFEQSILAAASRVVTPEAANAFIAPLLSEIGQGRADLTLLGILIALWSGSRMVRSVSEGVRVIHGAPRSRGYAWTRGLAILLYLGALVAAGLAVALISIAPQRLGPIVMVPTTLSMGLSYALLALLTVVLIVVVYQTASPERAPLRFDLLGAVVALAGWLVGSFGLHYYTDHLFSDFSVYAAVAAPIAIMLWSYVTAVAVLVGAAVSFTLAFPDRHPGSVMDDLMAPGRHSDLTIPS